MTVINNGETLHEKLLSMSNNRGVVRRYVSVELCMAFYKEHVAVVDDDHHYYYYYYYYYYYTVSQKK